jgi:hypothetical protein
VGSPRPICLEKWVKRWDIPIVITLKADSRKRVTIPDAKPGQVLAYENNGDGSFVLTTVKVQKNQPTAKLRREHGRTLVVPNQPINLDAIKEMAAEFP